MQVQGFAGIPLDISDFPTRHNYGLALWQRDFERILAGWVNELAVPIVREREVTGFAQDDTGVDVELSDGPSLRAQYLVGCDGGRSVVRKAAGIEFAGWDPTTSWLIAEVEMDEQPEIGMRREGGGIGPVNREQGGGPYRVVLRRTHVGHPGEPTMEELSEALVAAYGTDYGVHSPTWISRFTDMTRQAVSYREGRVLLAGDAAHVHPPARRPGPQHRHAGCGEPGMEAGPGGQGRLAESLLDTYHAERHPVGARVLQNTMAQIALSHPDDRQQGPPRDHDRAAEHGRAAQAVRRDALRSRRPLRPRRGTPAARAPHARSRPGHRERPRGLHPAARCPAGAAQPRRARRLRHHAMGRSGSGDRRHVCRHVGASGRWATSRPPLPC